MKDPALWPEYATSHALIIGIDKYRAASPLNWAVSDAKALEVVLRTRFGFAETNQSFLVDEEATRATIMSSYAALAGDATDKDDRVVVFFAGHGLTRPGARGPVGFLVPHDGDAQDFSTLIRWDELGRGAELIQAKHVLFIMDACYSGLMLSRGVAAGSMRFVKDMLLRPARQVITAGKDDEVVADAGGPRSGQSMFTGHLLDALEGQAADENGTITANGVMSYVYAKVSSDPHSHQTPAFGYIEGDGDLIFEAPILKTLTASQELDEDLLVKVPPTIGSNTAPAGALVPAVEKLLSDPAPHIELHNLGVERARRFAFETSSGKLPTQGVPFSDQELARRLQLYEREARDLEALCVCIAHWGAIQDLAILQKVLARATDELSPRDGLRAWNCLRWHPVLILTYAAGIAALAARRLDSLFALFDASAQSPETPGKRTSLLDATGEAVLEIERLKLFKRLPGHERQYVPRSEYMHKLLQPDLDEILFLGAEYEDRFDEFEVVLALAHADMRAARGDRAWGPIGRFGWKAHHPMGHPDPLSVVIERERQSKEFVKAGFFGRDPKRLEAAASWLMKAVEDLGWF